MRASAMPQQSSTSYRYICDSPLTHLPTCHTAISHISSPAPPPFLSGRARFLRQERSDQYGVKSHPADLKWYVYGFPMPEVRFTFNGKDIEMGGRYSHSYTRSGELSLFVNK